MSTSLWSGWIPSYSDGKPVALSDRPYVPSDAEVIVLLRAMMEAELPIFERFTLTELQGAEQRDALEAAYAALDITASVCAVLRERVAQLEREKAAMWREAAL